MRPLRGASSSYSRHAVALFAMLALGSTAQRASGTIVSSPTVTSSAQPFSPVYDAVNTLDGTEADYASAGLGDATFIEYSFGAAQTFDKIVVLNRDSPAQSDLIANFTVTLDGTTMVSVTRSALRGSSEIHSLGSLRTATTVRLDVDTIGTGDSFNNTGAMEVFFVRTPAGQTPIVASVIGSATPFAPFYGADNAADGIVGRSSSGVGDGVEYASASLGADAYVDFDLGAVRLVGGFDLFDRPADEDRVTGYNMIFSGNSTFGDGDDVVKSYTKTSMGASDVFNGVSARYVRYDVTANLGGPTANTGVSEVVFYQVPEPALAGLFGLGVLGMVGRRRR
jgi:hypothetical protein